MKEMKNIALLAAAIVLVLLPACKKDKPKEPEQEMELIDDLMAEAGPLAELESDLEKLETGELKSQLDTNNLPAGKHPYVVLFKSAFMPPMAEVFTGSEDDKESFAGTYGRNSRTKIRNYFDERTLPNDDIKEWFSVLSSGFLAELNPDQVKTIYRNDSVKCIFRDIPLDIVRDFTYAKGFTDGLFIHGSKAIAAGSTRTIWIMDGGGLMNSTYYNLRPDPISTTFGPAEAEAIDGHGTKVAFAAAGKEVSLNAFRGTAQNARIAMINHFGNYSNINTALEHIWVQSRGGDVLNMSWGVWEDATNKNQLVEIENNILDFKGWNIAVTISAGNQSVSPTKRVPQRLGLLYKKRPTENRFLNVVAAIEPVGTATQIKNATCDFKLSSYSNFGSTVRYAMIGSWQNPSGGTSDGTSFAAPALAGVLIHNTTVINNPKFLTKELKYTKGKYTYVHKIPTLN
jgi:hypothetical protein